MNIFSDKNFTIRVSYISKDKITITIYKRTPFITYEPWLRDLEFIKFDNLFKANLVEHNQFIIRVLVENKIIEIINDNIGFLTASFLCRLL